jgi:hypothetical protein
VTLSADDDDKHVASFTTKHTPEQTTTLLWEISVLGYTKDVIYNALLCLAATVFPYRPVEKNVRDVKNNTKKTSLLQ